MPWEVNSNAVDADEILHTSGGGLWSTKQAAVRIIDLEVPYVDGDLSFGELRVYFDVNTWDVDQHGLVYPDPLFLDELRTYLNAQGYYASVHYSEQGMQGRNFVSLDVDGRFLASFLVKNPGAFSMVGDYD